LGEDLNLTKGISSFASDSVRDEFLVTLREKFSNTVMTYTGLWSSSRCSSIWPIWPVHEKYNVKEYTTWIEAAWGQPGDVGQRDRVAEDKP